MGKTRDPNKCVKCGRRIAMASVSVRDLDVTFDQEPYDDETVEPVFVHNKEIETVEIDFHAICHVCPGCGWLRDFEVTP